MGIQTVRLYTNTTSEVPTTFTDVTAQFSGLDPNTVADEITSATITLSNLPPATTVFARVEAIDEARSNSGVQSVGSATTKERTIIGRGTVPPGTLFTASSRRFINAIYGSNAAVNGTFGFSSTNTTFPFPHWIRYQSPTTAVVLKYRIWAALDETNKDAPIEWTFEGSADGTSWDIVDTRVDSEPPDTTGLGLTLDSQVTLLIPCGEYDVATPGSYRLYCLNVTKTGGGTANRTTVLKVAEIELLGQ